MIGVQKARALREEALARGYLTIQEVAEKRGVSEATIRKLVDLGLLPAEDMTPDSKIRTLRIRADDELTLGTRLRAYKRATRDGRGEEYLRELRERWEGREAEELEAIREAHA